MNIKTKYNIGDIVDFRFQDYDYEGKIKSIIFRKNNNDEITYRISINNEEQVEFLYIDECNVLGLKDAMLDEESSKIETRNYNVGTSDYSKHKIQPWDIWQEYRLNGFDADIVKRILRRKTESGMNASESRKLDYEKIIHICKERIRQIDELGDGAL